MIWLAVNSSIPTNRKPFNMKRLISLLICMSTLVPAFAQDKEVWSGNLNIGMQKLPIVFNLQRGDHPVITLDSPVQNAFGIPATLQHLSADSIAVSVPLIGAEYKGRISGDVMSGVFRQSGYSFPLELTRGAAAKPQANKRPQTPQPPFPYTTREVTFSNPADGYTFHGTLTLPVHYKPGQKVRGVVLVTGSGIQNRDEELKGHRPFAVIADYLARHGVASLRYDDRGWDKSQKAGPLTVQSNIADASAALDWLANCNEIGEAGILGHSEGGIIGYAIGAGAGNTQPAFVVSLAGPLLKGDSLLVAQNRAILAKSGVDSLTVNQYCSLLPTALELMGSRNMQPLEDRIENLSPRMEASLIENLYSVAKTDNPWLKSFIAYDPTTSLKEITVPTLVCLGTKDVQVPYAENVKALTAINNSNLHLYTGEKHNHLFQRCNTGLPAEYEEIEETMDEEVLNAILTFILR